MKWLVKKFKNTIKRILFAVVVLIGCITLLLLAALAGLFVNLIGVFVFVSIITGGIGLIIWVLFFPNCLNTTMTLLKGIEKGLEDGKNGQN